MSLAIDDDCPCCGPGAPDACADCDTDTDTDTPKENPVTADSPLSRAEDAKHARNLPDEIRILTDADTDLRAQPWYPLLPGDVVLLNVDTGDEYGIHETYLAEHDGLDPVDPALLCVSMANGNVAPEECPLSFDDLWFEAGRDSLTVIRAGRVVFGNARRAGGV